MFVLLQLRLYVLLTLHRLVKPFNFSCQVSLVRFRLLEGVGNESEVLLTSPSFGRVRFVDFPEEGDRTEKTEDHNPESEIRISGDASKKGPERGNHERTSLNAAWQD